jgi:hypothetical protein
VVAFLVLDLYSTSVTCMCVCIYMCVYVFMCVYMCVYVFMCVYMCYKTVVEEIVVAFLVLDLYSTIVTCVLSAPLYVLLSCNMYHNNRHHYTPYTE